MGVEVVRFEAAPAPVETETEAKSVFLHDKENGKFDQEPGVPSPQNSVLMEMSLSKGRV